MTKDANIWDAYKRAVIPAQKKKRKAATAQPVAKKPIEQKAALRKSAAQHPVTLAVITAFASAGNEPTIKLERRREKSLRQGNIDIDATLDLHGMTQVEAFAALTDFMRKTAKAGKRQLLIVTGKGRDGGGILRGNLRGWLAQIVTESAILALRPAAPKHGGGGAFYVIMRQPKV